MSWRPAPSSSVIHLSTTSSQTSPSGTSSPKTLAHQQPDRLFTVLRPFARLDKSASASLQIIAVPPNASDSPCRASRHPLLRSRLPRHRKPPPPLVKAVPPHPKRHSSSPTTVGSGEAGAAAATPDRPRSRGISRAASPSTSRARSFERWMRMQRLSCSACRIHTAARDRLLSRIL